MARSVAVHSASDLARGNLRQGTDERWPHYAEDEIEAVGEILRSGRVNQWTGDEVGDFEHSFARRFGAGGRCIAVANGSVALELALRAFGIGSGDEVVVTPRSFVASATCVRLVGATPVFADVDPNSGNITAATIESVLSDRTKAVIPVHLAGWPCDMPAIMQLARRRGLRVIEDCAQSHGAEVDGRPTGSFGDAAAFSFCQDKIITTGGEGGATIFQDEVAWEWAWSYKDHGKNRRKVEVPAAGMAFRRLHDSIGTNWRLTGIQAAIGIKQLEKLEAWRATRTSNAQIWGASLSRVSGLRVPLPESRFRHAFYKFYVYLDVGSDPAPVRDEILTKAADAGLRVFSGSCSELYLEQAFQDLPRPNCPVARSLGRSSLMVEVHPTLRRDCLQGRAVKLAEIISTTIGELPQTANIG